jgi:hypothetical protein
MWEREEGQGERGNLILNSSGSRSILESGQSLLDIKLRGRDTSNHESATVASCEIR